MDESQPNEQFESAATLLKDGKLEGFILLSFGPDGRVGMNFGGAFEVYRALGVLSTAAHKLQVAAEIEEEQETQMLAETGPEIH